MNHRQDGMAAQSQAIRHEKQPGYSLSQQVAIQRILTLPERGLRALRVVSSKFTTWYQD